MHRSNQIISIFGRKGSGKTTLIGRLVEEYHNKYPNNPIFVLDFLHDQELPVKHEVIDYEDIPIKLNNREAGIFVIRNDENGDVTIEQMTDFGIRLASKIKDCLIVIDELDMNDEIGAAKLPKPLYMIINYGRHIGVSLIAAARRTQALPKTLLSQCDFIFAGQTVLPTEQKYFEEFGFEPEQLARLEVGEFLRYQAKGAIIRKVKVKPFHNNSVAKGDKTEEYEK